jgi:hypothetical protein
MAKSEHRNNYNKNRSHVETKYNPILTISLLLRLYVEGVPQGLGLSKYDIEN